MSVNDSDDTYKSEFERLKTFWNSKYFSKRGKFSIVGFYSLQEGDSVRCVFCGVVVKNWCASDWPLWRHVEANPSCPFLKGEDVGNEPILDICEKFCSDICPFCNAKITVRAHDTDCLFQKHMDERGFMIQKPIHVHMCNEYNRMTSFHSVKRLIANYSNYQMAQHGFFFRNNITKCFWCDGTFGNNWNLSEDMYREHVKHYPQCTFAQYYALGNKHIKEYLQLLPLEVEKINSLIQNRKPAVEYKKMEQESERLKTFEGHWLFMCQKKSIVEAGFFYVPNISGLQCAFCGIKLENWDEYLQGYSPTKLHIRKNPTCPFINGEEVGNVPIPTNDPDELCPFCGERNTTHNETCMFKKQLSMEDNILTPIHPQMSKPKDRLRTFPECNSIVHKLVKFGFFCSENIVKCFWCDKILKRYVHLGHEKTCPLGMLYQFCNNLSEKHLFRVFFRDYYMYKSLYYEPPAKQKLEIESLTELSLKLILNS